MSATPKLIIVLFFTTPFGRMVTSSNESLISDVYDHVETSGYNITHEVGILYLKINEPILPSSTVCIH